MKFSRTWLQLFTTFFLVLTPVLAFGAEDEIISGEFYHGYEDHFDESKSREFYQIRDEKTKEFKNLKFTKDDIPKELLNLPSGSKIKIRLKKVKGRNTKEVATFDRLVEAGGMKFKSTEDSLLASYPSSALKGTRKILAVRVNFLDANATCTDEANTFKLMFDPSNTQSVKNYYLTNSDKMFDLMGEVASVKISVNRSDSTTCDYREWRNKADALLVAAGYDLSQYQHQMYFLPAGLTACGWGGLAYINNRSSWVKQCSLKTMAHELGHNLGLRHASSTSYEYGDASDSMGSAYREFNSPHKEQLGWVPEEKIQIISNNGVFRLSPLNAEPESVSHPQILKIKKTDSTGYIYLSYRRSTGAFDSGLATTYANRLSVTHSKGIGYNSVFETALADGTSFKLTAPSLNIKNLSRTDSVLELSISDYNETTDTTPPVVVLAHPDNGSKFAIGTFITTSTKATDNIAVTKVELYVKNVLRCTDKTAPYSCSFSMPVGQNIPVHVRAYDEAGNFKDSNISYISSLDPIPPTITLTNPADGAKFVEGTTVVASADASDDQGVLIVRFYMGFTQICADFTAPYTCSFIMPKGTNIAIKARAYDKGLAYTTSKVSYISSIEDVDTTPPAVSLTSPINKSKFNVGSKVMATANAKDDRAVTQVRFYVNGVLKCTDTLAPYSCVFIMPAGTNIPVKAKAFDEAGNNSESEISFITGIPQVDTIPPTVTLLSPMSGSLYAEGSDVITTAEASDNIAVTKVEFHINSSIACTDLAPPYECNFKIKSGSKSTIKARAYDAAGNFKDSIISYVATLPRVDTTAPSVPKKVMLVKKRRRDVSVIFNPSKDNVGIDYYEIIRNKIVIGTTSKTQFENRRVPIGRHIYQVRAVDKSGNKSDLSAPAKISISSSPTKRGGRGKSNSREPGNLKRPERLK